MGALGIITMVTACRFGKRHTTIIENNNGSVVRIEYVGQAYFNTEETAIKSISPNGYVKYSRNGKELVAESDGQGRITYELNDDGKRSMLDDDDKAFLAQAVKDMIKRGHSADGR